MSVRLGRKRRRVAETLTAGAMLASGTQAYGGVILWLNPPEGHSDHFEWRGPLGTTTWLDITQSAANQSGFSGPSSVGQLEYAGVGVLTGGVPSVEMEVGIGGVYLEPISVFHEGVPSSPSTVWSSVGYTYYSGYGSQIPEGVLTYLGVRFDPGDGVHYGWIGVQRDDTGLEAFSWAYETEPGVPIPPFPEPGTLSMLAFGACGVAVRRRRKD
ncbi:MAG: PEP-CTERM sorting domain-containing protein [Phycisphaerales bacterium]|nr:PEP-CTERM sorting domain-containing protein [Phycisphaerales bacterium]